MRSLGAAGYQVCHLVRRLQTAHLELEHVLDVCERSSESFLKVPAHGSAFRCSADGLCVPTGNAPFFMSRSSSLTRRAGLRCEAVRPRPHSAPAYSRRVKTNARQCRGPQHDGSGPGSPPHGREVGKCRWPRFSVSTRFRGGILMPGDTING